MSDAHDDRVSVYDVNGRVVATRPRRDVKPSGQPVKVVDILLVDAEARVLLRRRPMDIENGGLWEHSVRGDVAADDTFDIAALRAAGETLFGDSASPRIRLANRAGVLTARTAQLAGHVVFYSVGVQLDLRDVRLRPGDELTRVEYNVGLYFGRTGVALDEYCPPVAVTDERRYFRAAEVDRLLSEGELAPTMAFLWLGRDWELLALAGVSPPARRIGC